MEHNTHVSEVCAALAKGKVEVSLPQPSVLRALDQAKRDLAAAIKPLVEELIRLETPLENEMLRSLIAQPELFFSPGMVRASNPPLDLGPLSASIPLPLGLGSLPAELRVFGDGITKEEEGADTEPNQEDSKTDSKQRRKREAPFNWGGLHAQRPATW